MQNWQIIVCFWHRKLIEKSKNSLNSARNAKQQMQLYKAQIVQSMNDEAKEMMRQALDEVSLYCPAYLCAFLCTCYQCQIHLIAHTFKSLLCLCRVFSLYYLAAVNAFDAVYCDR